MNESTEKKQEIAVLAGILTGRRGNEYTTEETMEELAELAKTAGAQVRGMVLQPKAVPESANVFGRGETPGAEGVLCSAGGGRGHI